MGSYSDKICRSYLSGKITYEKLLELKAKHEEKLAKRRKYKKGDKITSLQELLEQTWVIWHGRTTHIEVIKSLQLRIVLADIHYGIIYKAVENKKD